MKIGKEILNKIGLKSERLTDDERPEIVNHEYVLTSKSGIKLLLIFTQVNTYGKWVDDGNDFYLWNGESLYPIKIETAQDLYITAKVLQISGIDLDKLEQVINS